jgi:hypothetical protein
LLFSWPAVLAITVIVLTLLGLAYLAHRHNQTISFKVLAGGGFALALICAVLLLHSDVVEAIPELVRTSVVAVAYLSAAFFLLTILDTLIIGNCSSRGKAATFLTRSAIYCWARRSLWPR